MKKIKKEPTTLPSKEGVEQQEKSYYFKNSVVEALLTKYVQGGCVDVKLRDEIMSHATELIRQVIRTHNLHSIYPGHDPASFGDLMQIAYCQLEKSLYKFDWKPGHTKVFNMWCVSPDTMLMTNNGIERMGNVTASALESNIFGQAYGIGGLHNVEATKIKAPQDVVDITTSLGYNIKCTREHNILTLSSTGPHWMAAGDLKNGDLVGIQYNQQYFVNNDDISDIKLNSKVRDKWHPPTILTEELAYIIGLFISEGAFDTNAVCIYNSGIQVCESVLNNKSGIVFNYDKRNNKLYTCIKRFKEFLLALGFPEKLTAQTKFIPSRLLKCSKPILASLLRGIFSSNNYNIFSSSSKLLFDQVRMLLLNFGIISRVFVDDRIGYVSKIIRRNQTEGRMYGVSDHMYRLARTCKLNGKLQYDLGNNYNALWRIQRDFPIIESKVDHDNLDYKFVRERLDERVAISDNVIWLPVNKIKNDKSVVCEISVDSLDHSYIANGIISHNSQVTRTVILAHIKREMRDKKNYGSYKGHLSNKHRPNSAMFERFVNEAKEIAKYDPDALAIVGALEQLYQNDEKPYDGLIGKLVKISKLSRQKVIAFLKQVRLRSFEFTDSPLNQIRHSKSTGNPRYDEESDDDMEEDG